MATPTRWGILGTGLIASVFTKDLAHLDDNDVIAVASRRPGGATDFADTYSITTAYDSYADLLADPDVDIVYVAIPHSEHFNVGLQAIEAGKHVLIEKPFTLNASQAEQLRDAAAERGVFLMEAMWARFLPHFTELRRIIEAGQIGEIVSVFTDHGLRFDPAFPEHRLYDPSLGGGALLDLGIYSVSLCTSLLGNELEVKAVGVLTDTGVDGTVSAVFRDENGGQGAITTSLSSELSNRAVIAGTKGRVEIDYEFMGPRDLHVFTFGAGNPSKGENETIFTGAIDGHGIRLEAAEAARCIQAGLIESPIMPLALTIKTMKAMDDIRAQIGLTYAADIATS